MESRGIKKGAVIEDDKIIESKEYADKSESMSVLERMEAAKEHVQKCHDISIHDDLKKK